MGCIDPFTVTSTANLQFRGPLSADSVEKLDSWFDHSRRSHQDALRNFDSYLVTEITTCHILCDEVPGQAIGMAAIAFALLMGAEAVGSMLLFGQRLEAHFSSYATAAGGLGLAGQIAFGLLPIVQYVRNASSAAGVDGESDPKAPR